RARDWPRVEQLVGDIDVRGQPPSFLLAVAEVLPRQSEPQRLNLFRRIQQAYPGDFWTNHGLAQALVEGGQPAEAVRYHTAALALRPDNPGVYLNRAKALHEAGELDAALA